MAKLSSILFNRTINQFLECEDLESKKGRELTDKIRYSSQHFLDKMLQTIIKAQDPHRGVLIGICQENADSSSSEFFLDSLSHDDTQFRLCAADILSQSSSVSADKLFNRLHQSSAPKTEIIKTLSSQKKQLRPEDIINHAVKLNSEDAVELLKLAEGSKVTIDLSKLGIQPDKITDPTFKAALVRYFGSINQSPIVELILQFITDKSKLVVFETLRSLNQLNFRFNVSVLLPFIIDMNEVEQKLGLEVIEKQADASLLFSLPQYLSTKSESINEALLKIVVDHATEDSLLKFLRQLEKQDNWTRGQVIDHLESKADDRLTQVARSLAANDNEFVRSSAQKISGYLLDSDDLERIGEFALNENWQVRQRAIQTLGKSTNPGAIVILTEVLIQWPDAASSILDAVKQLGYSKGLTIALKCLGHSEASIQRSALETIMAITAEKHALSARDSIVSKLPSLNLELTEAAKNIARTLTMKFNLSAIDLEDPGIGNNRAASASKSRSRMPMLKPGSSWMNRYLIRQEIGQGAMGQVVLVEDEMMEELLILKFMHPELTIDKASRERFKREVKYARKVGHRNVIRVHDLLWQEEVCAISMEYFKSQGLEKKLKQTRFFDSREGLEILFQVCDGMAAAHEQAVIHRDLKPSNILIDDNGLVKIADFGIASAGSGAEQTLTQTGSIIGSPAYLAPERIYNAVADIRCDIYSLGIIAYYMFSGRLPYTGQPMDVLVKHREGNAPMAHEVNKSANPKISRLIKELMAINADDRPQSMLEVRDDIKKLLGSV